MSEQRMQMQRDIERRQAAWRKERRALVEDIKRQASLQRREDQRYRVYRREEV